MNTPFLTLLDQILAEAARRKILEGELARRAGIRPETLSRMKQRGSGDLAVVDRMARVVGLKLALLPEDEALAAIERGEFF